MKLYAGIVPIPALRGVIRDFRVMWALEEVEAKYEIEFVDPREDVNKDWYLAMNPFGKVPVIKEGDLTLFESGAICQYIADKNKKLIPAAGTRERLVHDQWLFATTNFELAARIFGCDHFMPPGTETDFVRKTTTDQLNNWLPGLEKRLAASPYLTGKEFQLCDLIMTANLHYVISKGMFPQYSAVNKYIQNNAERPAYRRAYEKNGG